MNALDLAVKVGMVVTAVGSAYLGYKTVNYVFDATADGFAEYNLQCNQEKSLRQLVEKAKTLSGVLGKKYTPAQNELLAGAWESTNRRNLQTAAYEYYEAKIKAMMAEITAPAVSERLTAVVVMA